MKLKSRKYYGAISQIKIVQYLVILALFNLYLIFAVKPVMAQEEKIIYQYKKYERIDLGDLEVKGDVLAPGDITIMERDRARFQRELFDKPDFNQEMRFVILNLR